MSAPDPLRTSRLAVGCTQARGAAMGKDLKNSILLWAGTLVFIGLFWAALHFDVAASIPDRWLWPMFGIMIGLNVLKSVWDYFRKRKATVR